MAQITGKGDLPTTWASEEKIKEKAPLAVKYLERKDALDLAEMLGIKETCRQGG